MCEREPHPPFRVHRQDERDPGCDLLVRESGRRVGRGPESSQKPRRVEPTLINIDDPLLAFQHWQHCSGVLLSEDEASFIVALDWYLFC